MLVVTRKQARWKVSGPVDEIWREQKDLASDPVRSSSWSYRFDDSHIIEGEELTVITYSFHSRVSSFTPFV